MCKDENAWVLAADSWLRHRIERTAARRIFLPAGETPRPLYRYWEEHGAPFSSQVRLLQVDEVLTNGNGMFRQFFQQCLPSFQKQFDYIDQADQVADLALLGLGTNGHVAFHEPDLPREFFSGCVHLDQATTIRLKLPPTARAITYGLGSFMRAQSVALLVRGESKHEILNKILEPQCTLPAAHLKSHPDLSIFTDFKI